MLIGVSTPGAVVISEYTLGDALAGSGGHRKHGEPRSTAQPILGPMRVAPGVMTPAQRRRRDVLLVLVGIVAVTFLAAVVTRSTMFIALQLLADAALAGYVYLLVQHKQRAQASRGMRLERVIARRDAAVAHQECARAGGQQHHDQREKSSPRARHRPDVEDHALQALPVMQRCARAAHLGHHQHRGHFGDQGDAQDLCRELHVAISEDGDDGDHQKEIALCHGAPEAAEIARQEIAGEACGEPHAHHHRHHAGGENFGS